MAGNYQGTHTVLREGSAAGVECCGSTAGVLRSANRSGAGKTTSDHENCCRALKAATSNQVRLHIDFICI